jgi:hypothetical protein
MFLRKRFVAELNIPLKKSEQETSDEECLAACDETLADSDDTVAGMSSGTSICGAQVRLTSTKPSEYCMSLVSLAEQLHVSWLTYGIQLSGPTFLLMS